MLQLLSLLAQPFAWPDLVMRAAVVVLGVGLVAVVVLAWFHGEKGQQRASGTELLMLAALLILAATGVALVSRGDGSGDAAARTTRGAAGADADARSIAVLPFDNIGNDPENEYFADGITEEILNALARIPRLRVPARTSSFYFKDKNLPTHEIARQLNVAQLLTGSVRRDSSQVIITVQLIDARTDEQLWSAKYERGLDDVFAVQAEIASAIANLLKVTLEATAAGKHIPEPEAYDLYLRGRSLLSKRGMYNLREAIALFESATAKDPEFAGAHASLASALAVGPYYSVGDSSSFGAADRSAQRALALDSTIADAHAALGYTMNSRGRYAESEPHFKKSLDIDPDNANTLVWYDALLRAQGRYAEAEAVIRRATELDPLSPVAWWNLSRSLIRFRRLPEAVDAARRAVAADTASAIAADHYARALVLSGERDSALVVAQRATRFDPSRRQSLSTLSYIYAILGRRADAERALDSIVAMGRPRTAQPIQVSMNYVALGKTDSALVWINMEIERAQRDREPPAAYQFLCDPEFDAIANDPRFVALETRWVTTKCPGRKR